MQIRDSFLLSLILLLGRLHWIRRRGRLSRQQGGVTPGAQLRFGSFLPDADAVQTRRFTDEEVLWEASCWGIGTTFLPGCGSTADFSGSLPACRSDRRMIGQHCLCRVWGQCRRFLDFLVYPPRQGLWSPILRRPR
ncbi:hypothetical protein D1007_22957 [Hordeum vulgare]|nr:hypothetical protein D1007_22957 [Hordeum vulgare]